MKTALEYFMWEERESFPFFLFFESSLSLGVDWCHHYEECVRL